MEDISQESRGSTRAAIMGEHHHQQGGSHQIITMINNDSGIFIEYYSMILLKKGPILSNRNSKLVSSNVELQKTRCFLCFNKLGKKLWRNFFEFSPKENVCPAQVCERGLHASDTKSHVGGTKFFKMQPVPVKLNAFMQWILITFNVHWVLFEKR